MTRAGDVDDVEIAMADDAVEMGVDEVEPGVVPQCPSRRGLMCSGANGSRSNGLSSR